MNGKQFLDALRDLGHADVPVVVMTAVQGLAQGVFPTDTDVIEKPFDLDDLLNKIALAVYRSTREARKTQPPPFDLPRAIAQPAADPEPPPSASEEEEDRGVVLLVDRDRVALQRLDAMLSKRGYTVVSMTRVTAQLPRLARALEPRAIILDVDSGEQPDDANALVAALRATPELREVPILVFARARESADIASVRDVTARVIRPVDEDLLQFVDRAGPVGRS